MRNDGRRIEPSKKEKNEKSEEQTLGIHYDSYQEATVHPLRTSITHAQETLIKLSSNSTHTQYTNHRHLAQPRQIIPNQTNTRNPKNPTPGAPATQTLLAGILRTPHSRRKRKKPFSSPSLPSVLQMKQPGR